MMQEEQGLLTRHELAARLRQIAQQVEAGEISLGDRDEALPEVAALTLRLTADGSQADLEIHVHWHPEAASRLA